MYEFDWKLPGEKVTHETRGIAEENVDKAKRCRQVLEVLGDDALTAKEIAVRMYQKGYIPTSERNFSAPRITELCRTGYIEPVGKKKCKYTGKTVAVFMRCDKELAVGERE